MQETIPDWVYATLGAAAVAAIVLCFASGVCEVGAIIAAVGEAAAAVIIWAMEEAGITVIGAAATTAATAGAL